MPMKRLAAVALMTVILLPGVAFAGSSTDAALGLGAFAVFNQILGGVGVFGRPAVVVAPAPPVVYAPAPPIVYAPAPPVMYAPSPPVVYAPSPPVVYGPPAVVYAPRQLVRPDRQRHARARREIGDRHADPHVGVGDGITRDGDAVHHVGTPDELRHEARARPVVEIVRRPRLSHLSRLQHRDAIGDHHRLPLVVRDVERRVAERLVQASDLEAHLLPEVGVQVGQWLVQQEDLRLDDERPRDGHPLLLAAGQLTRIACLVPGELDAAQHLAHARLAVAA